MISTELKEWRSSQKLTRIAAAEFISQKLGVLISHRTLEAWEQGRNEPNEVTQQAIRKAIAT